MFAHIIPLSDNITRVVYTYAPGEPKKSSLVSGDFIQQNDIRPNYAPENGGLAFKNGNNETVLAEIGHSLTEKQVYKFVVDGEPIIKYKQTANGEAAYIENSRQEPSGIAYGGRLEFAITKEEGLYGLGQHEDGVYNYNGRREYLYQTNMIISIPFVISSRNYGILIDTETAMIFDAANGRMTFTMDTVDEISYYVITGGGFDEIIRSFRELTGRAAMLPRWAFGYIQSRERYQTSEELIETAARFRSEDIPVDCIVQDWYSWEDGLWGEKRVDKNRYPDLSSLMSRLHGMHAKLMVSVWPNMAAGGSNYIEFKHSDMLLPNSAVYNAFDKEARAVYWRQLEADWFSAGADAFWCDSAEPFSDADWSGEDKRPEEARYDLIVDESKKSMPWAQLNSYGLYHAKGVYENWRKSGSEKRVVNLTRSTYVSGQRYAAIPWSGDISAKWTVLKQQIAEGIKMSMSGQPYWTLDIGGFFVVKDKWENRGCGKAGEREKLWFWNGDYNDGVNDLGYRELYVRFLQYAAFLPMFRSHGTDTPREPWQFGKSGEPFYDAIVKFIRLRYKLLPYIYSTAAAVYHSHDTMVRSLMFDFADDENVHDIALSYMFGRAFLVCPVTEPMYYAPNSVPIKNASLSRSVYLPKTAGCWYDYWTNKAYAGGQSAVCEAPLDMLPLFVRAGSIIPLSGALAFADERKGEVSEIHIYSGADGVFTLYNDEGDGYAFEQGHFSSITLKYDDQAKTLTLGKGRGSFPHQNRFTLRFITDGGVSEPIEVPYEGEQMAISLRPFN